MKSPEALNYEPYWPLMANNVNCDDIDSLIEFLNTSDIFTQSGQVEDFEKEWSKWLGVNYSVFVNSGSSANLLSMATMAMPLFGTRKEVILSPLTWVSDVAAILHNGLKPIFVDIDLETLGANPDKIIEKCNENTNCVFLTHVLGYDALSDKLLNYLKEHNIPLIEDACESHGATHNGKKVGSFGLQSNFSFYYSHHASTIEGGMICTNDEYLYDTLRCLRSHGMVRELKSETRKRNFQATHADLNKEFIFAFPAYNVRSTELNAVIGREQLKRLDRNVAERSRKLNLFLDNLDPSKYYTDFKREGNSNYAFTLLSKNCTKEKTNRIKKLLTKLEVEYRQGMSGGGNQLRQPYMRKYFRDNDMHVNLSEFYNTEYIHFHGFYIGNYNGVMDADIIGLCERLNEI